MENILPIIGRQAHLFDEDLKVYEKELLAKISSSNFLVIGAAGSIGQAVTKEIFKRNPKQLHCVDLSENNLVELVRDIRSSYGYINGDFKTFAIDAGSRGFDVFMEANNNYDYIFNLSALKHVRSESDPYSLMRMVEVNILNTIKTIEFYNSTPLTKYFCVSTDKAANPVNMMGASKRIMEMFLIKLSEKVNISTARFANVAFSDGSLLEGFNYRYEKEQPIAAPSDIKRYFITPQESGGLCLMSALFGENRDIYFPKLSKDLHLITFVEIAEKFLKQRGYKVYLCKTEEEARLEIGSLLRNKKWPCFFQESDTTGEKSFEEFFTENETIELNKYIDIGVVKNKLKVDEDLLDAFLVNIKELNSINNWKKEDVVKIFQECLPDFLHEEKGKYLDEKM